jgi:predicted transcriptional regulator
MTGHRKIQTTDLEQCLQAGLGVSETAKRLGVTKGAVSKRAKKIAINLNQLTQKEKVTRDVVLFHAGEIVGKEINGIEQLAKINNYANSLLDSLMGLIGGDGEAAERLQAQIEQKPSKLDFPKDMKGKDPRELALKAMAEIRQQISAQFEMLRDLYDMNRVAQFQEEVLTAIGEVEESVREKIIDNLRRKRIIRAIIKPD